MVLNHYESVKLHRINDFAAYQRFRIKCGDELDALHQHERDLNQQFQQSGAFNYPGTCWPLGKETQFLIDGKYPPPDGVNFRERLVCRKTGFNNRIRASIHVFEQLYQPDKNARLYLTEQHTVLFKWFKKHYAHVVGSEYLTGSHWFNRLKFRLRLFPEALNHQDLTALTYPDGCFDYVFSYDCFEHIPDYVAAFNEVRRVLKPSGKLMFSVPFDLAATNTLVRASHDDQGEVIHHVEADYHGNPVCKQGILSYYTFGWDVLEQLKAAGFAQAYGIIYWSKKYAYLGGQQLLLCAECD